MKKDYYVVTCPENGWDCVIGIFLSASKEEIYESLCINCYGEDYTYSNMEDIKDRYIIFKEHVTEIISKSEIRDQKIEQILKNG